MFWKNHLQQRTLTIEKQEKQQTFPQSLLHSFSKIPNILKWQNCKIFTKLVPSQTLSRSSNPSYSVKKGILKNLQNVTGKHLSWSLFLVKTDSNTCLFQWNLQNFWEHVFWRTGFTKLNQNVHLCLWRHRFLYNNIIIRLELMPPLLTSKNVEDKNCF